MAGPPSAATAPRADLALAAYLGDLAEDRRVLWLGDAHGEAADVLARRARSVLVLAPNPPPKGEAHGRGARISALRPGPLSFRPGSFDLVVAPDLSSVGLQDPARVEQVRALLGDGGVLVAGTSAGADGVGYEPLFDLLADTFEAVRMLGEAPFDAFAVIALGEAAGEPEVTFDGSLMDDDPEAARWIAVAGPADAPLDAYCVVQVPRPRGEEERAPEPAPRRTRRTEEREPRSDLDGRVAQLEADVDAHRREIEAAHEHAETLESTLADRASEVERLRDRLRAREAELAELRAELDRQVAPPVQAQAPAPAPDRPEVLADYDHLERALAAQGSRALELEREVDRRGLLVRDLVEELRELRARPAGLEPPASGSGGAGDAGTGPRVSPAELDVALERALAAEAARAEAQFQIDELMGRIASSEEGARDGRLREAHLVGTVRGLRSRLAEVQELRSLAEGRLSLVELDLTEAHARHVALERQMGELRDHLELELVRAQGAPGGQPEGDLSEREAALHASERRLSERVGTLSGQLVACRDLLMSVTEERDHARAEGLRLVALVSSLENRYEGASLGYRARIAELLYDGSATEEVQALRREAAALRGERDGLRARLDDREQALAVGTAAGVEAGVEAGDQAERLRRELERLRRGEAELSARVTDAEDRAAREAERAEDMRANAAPREALLTRLQMDLAQEEGHRRDLGQRLGRVEEENERLRGALLDASERVDEAIDAEERIRVSSRGRHQAEDVLSETRALLRALAEAFGGDGAGQVRREITAVGVESPAAEEGPGAELLRRRLGELEKQLADQDTLMRSLGAQIQERDDRVRALERRLEGSAGADGDEEALRRELMELQERAARLSDELLHERKARRAAEADGRKRTAGGEGDVRRLHERLGQSDAELLLLEGQKASAERDLKSIREACVQARSGLEELLGAATANGDPTTAERIGSLLRLLNRF